MSAIHDILILGSGAAGYTAALYAARANRKPMLLAGHQSGGQLTITTDVENYPGFPLGIMGPELMELMREQVVRFGTVIVPAAAERVDFTGKPLKVWADDGKLYEARAVIIATGATAKLLGIPSEDRLMGHGVSACATCDGAFFRDRTVMVIGGGDTAMEEANFLTRFAKDVVVVHRREGLRASKIMQDRARTNPRVRFIFNAEVDEILGNDKPAVTGARLRDTVTGAMSEHEIGGLFVAIGHRPNTEFLKGALPTDARGYLAVEAGSTRTKVAGVFAAGDVSDPTYRQAVTAAATGCMAALDAERYLDSMPEAHAQEAPAAKEPHTA